MTTEILEIRDQFGVPVVVYAPGTPEQAIWDSGDHYYQYPNSGMVLCVKDGKPRNKIWRPDQHLDGPTGGHVAKNAEFHRREVAPIPRGDSEVPDRWRGNGTLVKYTDNDVDIVPKDCVARYTPTQHVQMAHTAMYDMVHSQAELNRALARHLDVLAPLLEKLA